MHHGQVGGIQTNWFRNAKHDFSIEFKTLKKRIKERKVI